VHRTDPDPEENVMRAKLLIATAAGLAFLALPVLAQTPAGRPRRKQATMMTTTITTA
jgi:hypothetical protein